MNSIAVGIAHGFRAQIETDPVGVEPFGKTGFDPYRVMMILLDSDPVALPPAIQFVRCADGD